MQSGQWQRQSNDSIEKMSALAKSKGFFGREFLTWLWFRAETAGDSLSVGTSDGELAIHLWIDDRLVVAGLGGPSVESSHSGGDPSRSPEAAMALVTGKLVTRLKVGVTVPGRGEFVALLGADDLYPHSLELPKYDVQAAQESGGSTLESRIRDIEFFIEILHGLFREFSAQRISPAWTKDVIPAIRLWVQTRQERATRTSRILN